MSILLNFDLKIQGINKIHHNCYHTIFFTFIDFLICLYYPESNFITCLILDFEYEFNLLIICDFEY